MVSLHGTSTGKLTVQIPSEARLVHPQIDSSGLKDPAVLLVPPGMTLPNQPTGRMDKFDVITSVNGLSVSVPGGRDFSLGSDLPEPSPPSFQGGAEGGFMDQGMSLSPPSSSHPRAVGFDLFYNRQHLAPVVSCVNVSGLSERLTVGPSVMTAQPVGALTGVGWHVQSSLTHDNESTTTATTRKRVGGVEIIPLPPIQRTAPPLSSSSPGASTARRSSLPSSSPSSDFMAADSFPIRVCLARGTAVKLDVQSRLAIGPVVFSIVGRKLYQVELGVMATGVAANMGADNS